MKTEEIIFSVMTKMAEDIEANLKGLPAIEKYLENHSPKYLASDITKYLQKEGYEITKKPVADWPLCPVCKTTLGWGCNCPDNQNI